MGGYGLGLGTDADKASRPVGEVSEALNCVELEFVSLEDTEDQLVLKTCSCSCSLGCLMLSVPLAEGSGGVEGVPSLLEFPELSH